MDVPYVKKLWADLYGETLIQSETRLPGDRRANVGKSALLNEEPVTDLYVLFS